MTQPGETRAGGEVEVLARRLYESWAAQTPPEKLPLLFQELGDALSAAGPVVKRTIWIESASPIRVVREGGPCNTLPAGDYYLLVGEPDEAIDILRVAPEQNTGKDAS